MVRIFLRLILIGCLVSAGLILVSFGLGSRVSDDEIAYTLQSSNHGTDIYLLDLRSFAQANLTHARNIDNTNPVWSPDGIQLAFIRDTYGHDRATAICIYNGATRCYDRTSEAKQSLVWSLDSKHLSYQSSSIKLNTLDITDSTITSANLGQIPTFWSWSPDRTQFVFTTCDSAQAQLGQNCQIHLMKGDLSEVSFVYVGNRYTSNPSWSPDGTRIVFATSDETNAGEIDVFNPTNNRAVRIADFVGLDPVWSPDGTRIVYTAPDRSNHRHLYFINPQGGSPYTQNDLGQWLDLNYVWSPDRAHILFMGDQIYGSYAMFVLDLRTNIIANLPVSASRAIQFSWRP